jgi:hypothetical protein
MMMMMTTRKKMATPNQTMSPRSSENHRHVRMACAALLLVSVEAATMLEFSCPLSDEPPEEISALPPPAWLAAATIAWDCARVTQVEPTQSSLKKFPVEAWMSAPFPWWNMGFDIPSEPTCQ